MRERTQVEERDSNKVEPLESEKRSFRRGGSLAMSRGDVAELLLSLHSLAESDLEKRSRELSVASEGMVPKGMVGLRRGDCASCAHYRPDGEPCSRLRTDELSRRDTRGIASACRSKPE